MSAPLSPGQRGKIRIRQLPSGNYQADCLYVDMSGKQVRIRRTRKTAMLARRAVEAETKPTLMEGVETFGDLLEEWLSQHKGITSATRAKYGREIAYLLPHIGDLRIEHVDAASLQAGLDRVHLEISRDAARHARGRMGQACRWATRMRLLDTNPMVSVELSGRPTRRRAIAPSGAQIQTLRQVLHDYMAAPRSGPKSPMPLLAFEIMAGTGARISEVCALTWKGVNLKKGTIVFSDTVVDDDGGPRVLRGHLKNGDPHRTSYIPKRLVKFLAEAYRDTRYPVGPVVASQRGTMMQPENIRRTWRAAYELAEVPAEERLTPHALRRAVATKLKQELGTQGAADQLGDTLAVAEKHYVAPSFAGPKDAARILDDL